MTDPMSVEQAVETLDRVIGSAIHPNKRIEAWQVVRAALSAPAGCVVVTEEMIDCALRLLPNLPRVCMQVAIEDALAAAPAVSGAPPGYRYPLDDGEGHVVEVTDRGGYVRLAPGEADPTPHAAVSDPHNDSDMSVHCQQMGCQQLGIAKVSDPVAGVELPAFGIDTANHASVRVRGFTAEQVKAIIEDHARIVAEKDAEIKRLTNDYMESCAITRNWIAANDALSKRATAAEAMAGLLRKLYDAAAKGFHVSESCGGPDGHYAHISKFQTLADLQAYEDAWRTAMISARGALAGQATPEGS